LLMTRALADNYNWVCYRRDMKARGGRGKRKIGGMTKKKGNIREDAKKWGHQRGIGGRRGEEMGSGGGGESETLKKSHQFCL